MHYHEPGNPGEIPMMLHTTTPQRIDAITAEIMQIAAQEPIGNSVEATRRLHRLNAVVEALIRQQEANPAQAPFRLSAS